MADNNEHILNYRKIEEDENDTRHGLELLRQNVREQSLYLDDDIRPVNMQAEKRGTRRGLNFQLPGNIDFRVEDNRIIFSEFGMSKEELQTVYKFLVTMGFTGLSVPESEDEPFKQLVKDAYEDMAEVDGMFASNAFTGNSASDGQDDEENIPQPTAANNNAPSVPANNNGMSEEERIRHTREMAESLKTVIRPKPLPETPKKIHPSAEDISNYIDSFVTNTQKYKSNNYRKRSRANGWEVMVYKDADQKKEGPTADKKGKINPNFEFGLRGEIVKKYGKPHLQMTFLTPKYGDMADWMFDEVMNMADECKITHIKFGAGMQHKSKFFTACGKKLIIPTGINLKVKDIQGIYNAAQTNNDDPKKRTQFYLRFAEQLEEQMRKQGITDEAHPFVEWSKKLRDEARLEPEINKSKVKYKKFNQFFENNLMDRFFKDENDEQTAEPDAVKEIAGSNAYVRFLTEFKKDDKLVNLTDEDKLKVFKEYYNEEVFLVDKKLKDIMGDLYEKSDSASIERREKLLNTQFSNARNKVSGIAKNLKTDLGVEVDTISLQGSEYLPWVRDEDGNKVNPNRKRIAKGRAIHDRNLANSPMNMPRSRGD